jgi:hypothetical protein
MSNGIVLYNPVYTSLSLIFLLASVWVYAGLKNSFDRLFRLALIASAALSCFASVLPSWAVVLTVAFVPSFIYHTINPLLIAPLVVGCVGFIGSWCALVILREIYSLMLASYQPPQINITLTAFIIFIGMCYALRGGLADYQIIFHAQLNSRYAPAGNDPQRLADIYAEVERGTDARTFADVATLLASNHNAPAALLDEIYVHTRALALDTTSRGQVYRTLIKNPNTTPELFEKLMFSLSKTKTFSKDSPIMLPQDHQISQDNILQLADYPDCEIRRAILSYPNIPQTVLDTMSRQDPDMGIRHEARQRLDFIRGVSHLENNISTLPVVHEPSAISIAQIANMDSSAQLHQIYNQMTDEQNTQLVLESLASNCFINDDLARKIYVKADTLKHYSRTAVLKALAANPKTPSDLLNRLAEEKDLAILRELASNPGLTEKALAKLAPYPDCRIRKKIICSPDTPAVLLKQYRHDGDESVVLEVNQRLARKEDYLQSCVEIKKFNSSCQKYYSTTSPDMRLYPNTSRLEPLWKMFRNYMT